MEEAPRHGQYRIRSIDILRGLIMVIMALDHVRDYYTNVPFDPLDLSKTGPALFFTRWITHFCAPTFIFLSGISARLSLAKKNDHRQAALFLLKRGLWLILLEFSLIGFGWMFDIGFHMMLAQVIWAIGCSMIFLALLLFLNLRPMVIGLIGLFMIFGHNALDHIRSGTLGEYRLVWLILHEQGMYQFNDYESVFLLYPLIPWVGVMAAGYSFGGFFKFEPERRRRLFIRTGLACLGLFLVIRGLNIYGDPFPWQAQGIWWKDILAFIKCHKYPPSLSYLLMTLGVSITCLGLLERTDSPFSRILTVYGRVPFFYYVLHIYLVHLSQVLIAFALGFTTQDLLNAFQGSPGKWGFDLPIVYLIWLSIVFILFFPCRWFMKVKQRRKDWWLSYI